jgi:hypothetical protein
VSDGPAAPRHSERRADDGCVIEMHAGEVFYIPPTPHDSWVVGNEPYVSLHFLGADHYAKS